MLYQLSYEIIAFYCNPFCFGSAKIGEITIAPNFYSGIFLLLFNRLSTTRFLSFTFVIKKIFMGFYNNKVVLVTGGSDGIGKALVDALLSQGAKVATCARNLDKLYQLQTSHAGKPLITLSADVSSETDCKNLLKR